MKKKQQTLKINNMTNTTYPILYKIIPVQFAFYVSKDGTVQITTISDIPKKLKFKDEKDARKFISKYKQQY